MTAAVGRPRRAGARAWRALSSHALTVLLIALSLVIVGVPILMAVAWSLVDPKTGWSYPDMLPPSVSLYQWEYVFRYTEIVPAIATSYALASVATVMSFLISLPMAYAMGRWDFRGKEAIRILMLLPLVIPGMVVALFLSRVFIFFGLVQTFHGLAIAHTLLALPYMARLLSTSFEAIPKNVSDAASNLGASELVKLRTIYLPLVRPGIFAGAIFTFIASLEEFSLTYVIGTPDYQTIPTILFSFLGQRFVRTQASVVSLVLLVPSLVLLLVADRFLKRDYLSAGFSKL